MEPRNYRKRCAGQNGCYDYEGIAAFTTTGATVEVHVPFKTILAVSLLWLGTPNANEPLSLNEATAGTGATNDPFTIPVPASGLVTVTRAAGTTSGGKFSYRFVGR